MSLPSLPIEDFSYAYLSGPRDSAHELNQPVTEGNCRLAIQLYYYRLHGLYIPRDDIYLPGGYKHLGNFVFEETTIDYALLKPGDILYAQNIKNKRGESIDRSRESYTSKDEWLYHLHSALYVGFCDEQHYLWHATAVHGGTCLWTLEQFTGFYLPISAKRIL